LKTVWAFEKVALSQNKKPGAFFTRLLKIQVAY